MSAFNSSILVSTSFIFLSKEGADLFQIVKVKKLILNTLEHDMNVIDLLLYLINEQFNLVDIKTSYEIKRQNKINSFIEMENRMAVKSLIFLLKGQRFDPQLNMYLKLYL